MRSFDPYDELGVPRDADPASIRRAYQKLARRHHPDLAPGDQAAARRFERIQRAYRLLGDPDRRRRFDSAGTGRARVTTGRLGSESFLEIRAEWLEWIDAPSDAAGEEPVSADVHAEVTLDLAEAVRGVTTSFSVQRERLCERCDGEGVERGAGRCERCAGRRTVVDLDRIRVRIPPGVDDGTRLRIPGKGAPLESGPGAGDESGDLFLTVRVRPHPYFRRDGLDIHGGLPVTFAEAVLGTELEVPTVDGPVAVRLPAGTQGGQRFRLKGRGIARSDGHGERVGDHYYTVRIVVPTGAVEPGDREALERLGRLDGGRQGRGGDPRSGLPRGLE